MAAEAGKALMPDTEGVPYKAVKESAFDVELEWEVPWDFWEEEPEPPYEDPAQLRLFELEPPFRTDWLDRFHDELMKRGWPQQNIEAVYSYFEDVVEDPREGEEKEDPFLRPLMRFRVWIPGDWLAEHPDFFTSFDKLAKEGVRIRTDGDEGPYHLAYWRIYADRGPLEGTDWGDSGWFTVRPPRERPPAMREKGPKEWFPELSGPGHGYDERLPSRPPFQWVEGYKRVGDLAVVAYGAYNAFGLIGPEKGGVAVVLEEPEKAVVATKDFPYDPKGRAEEFKRIVGLLSSPKDWSPRGAGALRHRLPALVSKLRGLGYGVR